jgi:uncharacterized membrane protein YhaH (DUF805 family)
MAAGAVLCVKCGYHLQRGTKVDVDLPPKDVSLLPKMTVVRDPANPYRSPTTELGEAQPRERFVLRELFTTSGRIPRWKFWAWQGGFYVNMFIFGSLAEAGLVPETVPMFAMLISFWFMVMSQIKRWHDTDRSGWWMLINLIPFGSFVSLVILGFHRGTDGPNQYGPDPLGN